MEKAYHYTSLKKLDHGPEAVKKLHGRRIGEYTPAGRNEGAVFCLDEPEPEQWTRNEEFEYIWTKLKGKVGMLLVEIDLVDTENDVFVLDWGVMERGLESPQKTLAEEAYLASRKNLSEFLANRETFSLPEICIPVPISPERVSISSHQPLLVDAFSYGPELLRFRRDILNAVLETPELHWIAEQSPHTYPIQGLQ